MYAVKKIVEGNVLDSIIDLPEPLRNALVEITVRLVDATENRPVLSRNVLEETLQGSHTAALSGALDTLSDASVDELLVQRRSQL